MKQSRRNFLKGLGLTVLGGLALGVGVLRRVFRTESASVSGATPGFVVPADTTTQIVGVVTATANVIVYGTLVMRPGSSLTFLNVNEQAFVGGGMDPIASDVGLWVMDAGKLDIQGTAKTAWNHTGTDPTWKTGDEIRVAPTNQGDFGASGFPVFTPGSAVPRAHASVPAAEVLNLSRDIAIQGRPGHRAHIFIRSTQPQTIRYCTIRYMGPRKVDASKPIGTAKVLGRWMLHFHHCDAGSVGSLVEGVVARDGGSHAFVPHASNGVTFRDCIAYQNNESHYWWDSEVSTDASSNVTYDHCVAALEKVGDDAHADNTGFKFVVGSGNAALGCVAVGIGGTNNSSGFNWPEGGGGGTWRFEDCVAHNNSGRGGYWWHNQADVSPRRLGTRFTTYRNGPDGLTAGAYTFQFDWTDPVFYDENTALDIQALGPSTGNVFTLPVITGGGTAIGIHGASTPAATAWEQIIEPVLTSVETAVHVASSSVRKFSLVRPLRDGRDLEPTDVVRVSAPPGSYLRSQRRDGTAWQMDLNTGAVTTIPAFA